MLKIFLAFLICIQLSYASSFYRTNFAAVDRGTMLMWQDTEETINLMFTHKEAIEYCENLTLGGFDNWRLPKIDELKTIVDTKNHPYYINRIFKNKIASGYWARDTLWRTLNFYAWYMNFLSGTPYYYNRDYHKYVRCVRDIR